MLWCLCVETVSLLASSGRWLGLAVFNVSGRRAKPSADQGSTSFCLVCRVSSAIVGWVLRQSGQRGDYDDGGDGDRKMKVEMFAGGFRDEQTLC